MSRHGPSPLMWERGTSRRMDSRRARRRRRRELILLAHHADSTNERLERSGRV